MKMYIVLKSDYVNTSEPDIKAKFIVDDPDYVPHVGEHVFVGYNPPPVVTNVVYFYDKQYILIIID